MEQQKEGEESLRESEKRFRALFETLPLGVVYQDRRGEIICANPAAERILGLTIDQLRGRTSLDPGWRAIHEDGTDFPGETHPAMQALATGHEVENVVMGVYHPATEEYVWINIRAVPQFRPGVDRPYQVCALFEDINEKKKVEKVVKEKEERIRFITENMVDMLSQVDADLVIRYISPSHHRVLGYKPEELIGQPVSRLVHPEDRDEVSKTMGQVIRAGGPAARIEYRYRKADGEYLWVETLATILYRPEGGLAGIIYASRDNGERKKIEAEQRQLEENLKREKEKFQILVDASPLGVSLMGSDGRYKYLNPKFTAIFGYTLEDVPAGRDWFRKAYPDETYRREVIAQWLKDLQEFPQWRVPPEDF